MTSERATGSVAVLHFVRKVRRRKGSLRRGTAGVRGSYRKMLEVERTAMEKAPSASEAAKAVRPELSRRLLVGVLILAFGVDFAFFFTLYRDVFDALSPLSIETVNAALLALLTPIAVMVFAVPLGRRWAKWRVGALARERAEWTMSALLTLLLAALMAVFGIAAAHRFDSASQQVGATAAPTGAVVLLFTLLPVLVMVAHAVVDTPGLRAAVERDALRRWVRRVQARHDRRYGRLEFLVENLMSTWADVPALVVEARVQAARAAGEVTSVADGRRDLQTLPEQGLGRLVPLQGTGLVLPPLPARILVPAIWALEQCPLADAEVDVLAQDPPEDPSEQTSASQPGQLHLFDDRRAG